MLGRELANKGVVFTLEDMEHPFQYTGMAVFQRGCKLDELFRL